MKDEENKDREIRKTVNIEGDSRDKKDGNTLADYFKFGEVATYFFRKKDPNRPTNFNIRAMHIINKISITVFLLAIIFFILKKIL